MNRVALKHRLLDRGMTMAVLANRIGTSYDRLVKVVNGYREPRREEIERIAAVLAMKPEELQLEAPDHDE